MVVRVIVGIVGVAFILFGLYAAVKDPPKPKRKRGQPQVIATVTGRRPTVTRTGLGLLLGGLPGGLLGFAWRKKSRDRIELP